MSEGFWSEVNTEPKRAYRWILYLGGIPQWICKKVAKPSFTVSESMHTYLNHKFYYPGRVEWNTVAITLADPVAPDAAATMMSIIQGSGYNLPKTQQAAEMGTMSKLHAVDSLGRVAIHQIGPEGDVIEEWELVNAWIKDVKFGDLDYESDDMVDVEIELRYDFAQLNKAGDPAPTGGWEGI